MTGIILFVAGLVVVAPPDRQYDREARIAHLRDALAGVQQTDLQTLENAYRYIETMERNACASSIARLRINCLVEKARRNCRGHKPKAKRTACLRYSDLLVVNAMAAAGLVSKAKRFALMQTQADYRRALRRELELLYGELAAGFRLSSSYGCTGTDPECLATAIDNYCLAYTDTGNISWQYCSAGLVWFVGTAGRVE